MAVTPDTPIADTDINTDAKDAELLYPDANADANKADDDDAVGDDKDPGKTPDDKPIEDKDKKPDVDPEANKKPDVDATPEPVKAEDIKFQEGIQVDESIQNKFLDFVNEHKLSASAAQGLVDLQQELAVSQQLAHETQITSWEAEVAKDKEIIGDTGDKMVENLAIAKKGFETLKVDGLMELLETTGFGSHPAIVKAGFRLGTLVSEDSFRTGSFSGRTTPKSDAEVLYSNDVPK